MGNFDFKKELRKQILIREGWEDVAASQGAEGPDDTRWGLTSKTNQNSLENMLKDILDDEKREELIDLVAKLADEQKNPVALEELDLVGLESERDRIINSDEIIDLLKKYELDDEKLIEIIKILNEWGRLNSVKFNTPPRAIHPDSEGTGGDEEPSVGKEKYRMSLASLERTLENIIDKENILNWEHWIERIRDAIKEDIPDMRLDEARDQVFVGNTLDALYSLRSAYRKRGLDFKPLERVVYDFLKVNNLEASPTAKAELHSGSEATPEEDWPDDELPPEEWERDETEEAPKPKDVAGDKKYCSDLLSSLKKSNPELFDDLKFDQSVAGSLSNLANDISFSADAVALSAMAAGASFPPAGPGAIIVAGGAEIVARQAAGVAVVADLFSGEYKKAAIDAIGLIPWGRYAAKGLGKLGSKLAKAGSESSSEIIKKLAKTLGGASASLAEKGVEGLTESLVAKMVSAGVDEATAKAAAKALTTALEQKIQNTYKTLADGAPSRDGKTEEEYREALKKYRTMKREAIDNEYKKCMTKEGTAFQQTLINFFNESDKLVDDIPAAFDSLIDAGLSFAGEGLEKIGDVYSWFEKMVGDEKAEEETTRKPKAPELPPSPAVPAGMGRRATTRPKKSKLPPGTLRAPDRLRELKRRLNEQRYRMLLKRFNI